MFATVQQQSPLVINTFFSITNSLNKKFFVIDPNTSFYQKIGNYLKKAVIAIALILSVVALPVFILLEQVFRLGRRIYQIKYPLRPDCHFAFSSRVFSKYAEQLFSFLDAF